jgi:hypothetical protein
VTTDARHVVPQKNAWRRLYRQLNDFAATARAGKVRDKSRVWMLDQGVGGVRVCWIKTNFFLNRGITAIFKIDVGWIFKCSLF